MWSRLSTTTLALALMALLVAPLASADDMDMPDTSKVTCGSTIKLQHVGTKARLHSHDISYVSSPAVPATRIALSIPSTRRDRVDVRSDPPIDPARPRPRARPVLSDPSPPPVTSFPLPRAQTQETGDSLGTLLTRKPRRSCAS